MDQVQITPLDPSFADNRGETYELENNRSTNLVLCVRNANTISGRHYHTGISKNKDPEVIYLIQGKVFFRWRKLNEEKIQERIVMGPSQFIVPIQIWHELETITDAIFLELNSLEDGKKDTTKLE